MLLEILSIVALVMLALLGLNAGGMISLSKLEHILPAVFVLGILICAFVLIRLRRKNSASII